MKESKPLTKPLLRGHFHEGAFYTALGACSVLIYESADSGSFWPVVVYTFGVLSMFGFSALYHRPMWSPQKRKFFGRLDHSGIFLMIAGSGTPIAAKFEPAAGFKILVLMWSIATAGIIQSLFVRNLPKWVAALLYIGAGWIVVPYLPHFKAALTDTQLHLIFIGGILYTVGALAYAFKWPKLNPKYFGYHEVFHILVVFAAITHFIVIYQLSKR